MFYIMTDKKKEKRSIWKVVPGKGKITKVILEKYFGNWKREGTSHNLLSKLL